MKPGGKLSFRKTIQLHAAAFDAMRPAGMPPIIIQPRFHVPIARTTPRMPSNEPTEKDIQTAICAALRTNTRIEWFMRLNSGAAMYEGNPVFFYALYIGDAPPIHKGAADIIGMLVGTAQFFALEVKKPGKRATEEQAEFLDAVNKGGGIGRVVTSVEEAERALG